MDPLILRIEGDADGAKKELKSLTSDVKDTTNEVSKTGDAAAKTGSKSDKGFKRMGAGAQFAMIKIMAVVAAVKAVIGAVTDYAKSTARLNAVANASVERTGVGMVKMARMANSINKYTGDSVTTIQNAQAEMLKFGNISGDSFERVMKSAGDLAVVTGQDLTSSTRMLGQALDDPERGMARLRRIGVNLSQAQEDQVKQFMAVNDAASAQAIILGEVEERFHGVAEEVNNTPIGDLDTHLNSIKDGIADLAKNLLPIISKVVGAISSFVAGIRSVAITLGLATKNMNDYIKANEKAIQVLNDADASTRKNAWNTMELAENMQDLSKEIDKVYEAAKKDPTAQNINRLKEMSELYFEMQKNAEKMAEKAGDAMGNLANKTLAAAQKTSHSWQRGMHHVIEASTKTTNEVLRDQLKLEVESLKFLDRMVQSTIKRAKKAQQMMGKAFGEDPVLKRSIAQSEAYKKEIAERKKSIAQLDKQIAAENKLKDIVIPDSASRSVGGGSRGDGEKSYTDISSQIEELRELNEQYAQNATEAEIKLFQLKQANQRELNDVKEREDITSEQKEQLLHEMRIQQERELQEFKDENMARATQQLEDDIKKISDMSLQIADKAFEFLDIIGDDALESNEKIEAIWSNIASTAADIAADFGPAGQVVSGAIKLFERIRTGIKKLFGGEDIPWIDTFADKVKDGLEDLSYAHQMGQVTENDYLKDKVTLYNESIAKLNNEIRKKGESVELAEKLKSLELDRHKTQEQINNLKERELRLVRNVNQELLRGASGFAIHRQQQQHQQSALGRMAGINFGSAATQVVNNRNVSGGDTHYHIAGVSVDRPQEAIRELDRLVYSQTGGSLL